ncbi:MAG: motility associated factor glycosyltransferase family protein [Roseburia sp.]
MKNNQKDENLEYLDSLYHGIKQIIEERKERLLKKEQIKIEEEESLDGETILKVSKDDRSLYLAGKRSPEGPAKNQIGLLGKIEATAPIFIVGLGNIHYLKELVAVTDKTVMILVYEPSFTIFYKVIELWNLKDIFADHTIALCIEGINEEGYESLIYQMLQGDRVAIMKNFVLPNYEVFCAKQVHDFIKQLTKMAKGYRINVNTEIRYSEVKADNLFHNVDFVRTGYKVGQLQEILPLDVPAIIVSAGPSLNKNIRELKKAKNKAFIIAVDTAIKPLLKEGIKPDMFAVIDGLKPLNLVEVEECREIPLVTSADAAKSVLSYHTGKKFFYDEGKDYVNHLFAINGKILEELEIGGSVATLAMSLVSHVGFQTIILVGQDLAYTNNKSHADGTFQEKMNELDTSHYKMVEGNYEEKVPTDIPLDNYREWFEDFITYWKSIDDKFRVINATEGGAKIHGTEIMSLKEAIDKECKKTVEIKTCFDKLNPVFTQEEQEKILQFFQNTPKEIHQIVVLAREGKKYYIKLKKMCSSNNMDQAGYLKILKKIKKINKKIETNINYQMISETLALADAIIKMGQYMEYTTFEKEGLEIARKGLQYMELLEQCATILENLAEQTVGNVGNE